MSIVSLLGRDGDWTVWINLADGSKAPKGLSFVIGGGETREAALADAVSDLEDAIAQCQSPAVLEAARDFEPEAVDYSVGGIEP